VWYVLYSIVRLYNYLWLPRNVVQSLTPYGLMKPVAGGRQSRGTNLVFVFRVVTILTLMRVLSHIYYWSHAKLVFLCRESVIPLINPKNDTPVGGSWLMMSLVQEEVILGWSQYNYSSWIFYWNIVSSAGPIPGIVNQGIDYFRDFCGRARRLDSKIKESSPSPSTILYQNGYK
jgi:hypothetical protein